MEKKVNFIKYKGIKTNNLKNINIEIEKNKIIGIGGPSGSGKSSLAYGTIYSISEFEEAKLRNEMGGIKKFVIDSYKNVIPAVELKQTNNNNNPRSTIATFLDLDTEFKMIFTKINNVSPTKFTFNMPANACKKCLGRGVIHDLDINKIIDYEKSIEEGAFIPWRKSTVGYEEKLLIKFAEDNNISTTCKIKSLNEKERDMLFYSNSEKVYNVSYKAYGKPRNKKFKYVGLLKERKMYLEDINQPSSKQKIENYSIEIECPVCSGKRFNEDVLKYKVMEKSLGDFYTMEIVELYNFFSDNAVPENIKENIENIKQVLKEIINSDLGYLNLNRSIPTLSGGEFQRIRLVNITNSQISNMLYVIDEPSAKLHVSEYENLYNNFVRIKKQENTIIFVEHNPYFLNKSDKVFYIGPDSGKDGGYICSKNDFDEIEYKNKKVKKIEKYEEIKDININNVKNLNIKLPLNCVIGIYGVSGSGKSSIVKELNKRIKESEYISQKPLRGSGVSTIGTYSGTLFKDIREELSKKMNLDPNMLNFNSEKGACPSCDGKGVKKFNFDYGKEVEVLCEECQGKRYSQQALQYKYLGKNIYEILNMDLKDLIRENFFEDKKIINKLKLLEKLGLGYLNLFRTTNTLSGGEAQRVKLSDIIGKKIKNKILFFDEPLSGLSSKDSLNILKLFKELTEVGITIVFIEHNILGLDICDYIIEIGPGKGKNGGKIIFEGTIEKFKNHEEYKKYEKFEKYK